MSGGLGWGRKKQLNGREMLRVAMWCEGMFI